MASEFSLLIVFIRRWMYEYLVTSEPVASATNIYVLLSCVCIRNFSNIITLIIFVVMLVTSIFIVLVKEIYIFLPKT